MPEHIHLLITEPEIGNPSKSLQILSGLIRIDSLEEALVQRHLRRDVKPHTPEEAKRLQGKRQNPHPLQKNAKDAAPTRISALGSVVVRQFVSSLRHPPKKRNTHILCRKGCGAVS